MRRETWFKALVPSVAVVTTLLVAELALQLLPAPRFESLFPNAAMWGHWTHRIESWQDRAAHYKRSYALEPGVGHVRTPPFVEYANAAGDARATRIVFVGDSVTELGRFAEYFRDEVARVAPDRAFVAIDAGVVGYDPVLEERFLRRYLGELEPNVVVLQFCPNDFKRTPVIVPSADGTWLAFNGGGLDRLLAFAFGTRSRLLQLVAGNANALLTERSRFDDDEMRTHLIRIRDLVRERGAEIRFAIFPHFFDPQNASSLAIERIQADVFAPDEVILMREHLAPLPEASDDGIHLNEPGRRAAAVAFHGELAELLVESDATRVR